MSPKTIQNLYSVTYGKIALLRRNLQLAEDVSPNSDNVSSDSEQICLNFGRYIAVNLMRRKFDTDVTLTFNVPSISG